MEYVGRLGKMFRRPDFLRKLSADTVLLKPQFLKKPFNRFFFG